MSKLAEQLKSIVKDRPCATVPTAQLKALLAGKGRVEHLLTVVEEYGYVVRLERKSSPKRSES